MWMLVLAGVLSLLPLSHQAGGWNMLPWPGRKASVLSLIKIYYKKLSSYVGWVIYPRQSLKLQQLAGSTTSWRRMLYLQSVQLFITAPQISKCTIPCTMYMFFLSTFYHPTLRMSVLFVCLVEPHKLLSPCTLFLWKHQHVYFLTLVTFVRIFNPPRHQKVFPDLIKCAPGEVMALLGEILTATYDCQHHQHHCSFYFKCHFQLQSRGKW